MQEKVTSWDIELWSAASKRGEVRGIFYCPGFPAEECPHCGHWYCHAHKGVINTPGHQTKEEA